jgi:O-antigen/teichoic acid export membrane protein
MQSNSLTRRYIFKLSTSVLIVPINLLLVSIISRSLGPELFGQYRYLIYFFTLLSSFIGFGGNFLTSELAKNNDVKNLVSFYQFFSISVWLIIALLIAILIWFDGIVYVFPEVTDIRFIWLGFLLAFITFLSQTFESMSDACGLTKKASVYSFFSKLIGVILLAVFVYILKWVNLYWIFLISIIIVIISSIVLARVLLANGIFTTISLISWLDFKKKFREFFQYSNPLLSGSIVLFFFGFSTRWGLQFFGGSIEQGYFSFSEAFSGFVIIFANSVTPLLQREFSISFNKNSLSEVKSLIEKSLLIFIAFTSFISIFLVFNVTLFTSFIGGSSFGDSILCTQIMLIYTLPYVGNNILNSVYYALSKTRLLRNIQVIVSLLNLIISWFLIAPNYYGGLNLGAIGFAISMIIATSINHMLLLIYCSRILDLNLVELILKYLKIIFSFVFIGLCFYLLGNALEINVLLRLFIAGLLYTLTSVLLLFYFPSLIGFSRLNIKEYIEVIKNKMN